jgi:hypothetical protein
VIAQLVQADEDTVRDVIHRFNEIGLACLDHWWAGGLPRLLSPDDEDFVVRTATIRSAKLGQPFTRWSIRKLAPYPRKVHGRVIWNGCEALRCLLARRGVTFQGTETWGNPRTPIARRSWTGSRRSLTVSPTGSWPSTSSARSGSVPPRARAGPSRSAPTGCPPPTTALTACGTSNSHHPNHIVQPRALHAYPRWRNANARPPDVPGGAASRTCPYPKREGRPLGRTSRAVAS